MKNSFLILFLCLIFIQKDSFASHAMGGEITYQCLGGNQYQLRFTFYRDCTGIPAPSFMAISVTSSCFVNQSINLNPTPQSPQQISPICSTVSSSCDGGNFIGIEEWIYEGTVTLPGPCVDWMFSHSENARNAAITTISGAGVEDLFVFATLNNTNGICNNSPVFSNRPMPMACINQRFCFNHGAIDSEGDSLSFQLVTPRIGPLFSDTVTYLAGHSATQPIISNPPMTFNEQSGDFCMTPQQPEVSCMAVLVNEFRNGVLIGQVLRDLQITILNCGNLLPQLTGINGLPPFDINVCANQENCFFISSFDPDVSQTTTITYDFAIPNMTFTTSSGVRDTAFFCLTPDSSFTDSILCFTATVMDNNCPYTGTQTYSYCLVLDHSPGCQPVGIATMPRYNYQFTIYPQPASGDIHFDFTHGLNSRSIKNLIIENMLGETVYMTPVSASMLTIDAHQINADGIFIARITDANDKTIGIQKMLLIR